MSNVSDDSSDQSAKMENTNTSLKNIEEKKKEVSLQARINKLIERIEKEHRKLYPDPHSKEENYFNTYSHYDGISFKGIDEGNKVKFWDRIKGFFCKIGQRELECLASLYNIKLAFTKKPASTVKGGTEDVKRTPKKIMTIEDPEREPLDSSLDIREVKMSKRNGDLRNSSSMNDRILSKREIQKGIASKKIRKDSSVLEGGNNDEEASLEETASGYALRIDARKRYIRNFEDKKELHMQKLLTGIVHMNDVGEDDNDSIIDIREFYNDDEEEVQLDKKFRAKMELCDLELIPEDSIWSEDVKRYDDPVGSALALLREELEETAYKNALYTKGLVERIVEQQEFEEMNASSIKRLKKCEEEYQKIKPFMQEKHKLQKHKEDQELYDRNVDTEGYEGAIIQDAQMLTNINRRNKISKFQSLSTEHTYNTRLRKRPQDSISKASDSLMEEHDMRDLEGMENERTPVLESVMDTDFDDTLKYVCK